MKDYHAQQRESPHAFGKILMYGEVVTSTNTMLDKNPSWLEHLPTGLVATATTQVAGRGRGSNVWVSPPGSMPFSFVLRHSLALSNSAPVVFVQYLAALAVVKGIQGYDTGYEAMPIKLKWPNDIYALDPTKPASEKAYVKIGGTVVHVLKVAVKPSAAKARVHGFELREDRREEFLDGQSGEVRFGGELGEGRRSNCNNASRRPRPRL